ncbi:hypothetical protein POM88_009604 [Heracleum sosnowskyi]|uniref:Zinc-ribbon domain-containing protein n=1 Tax=Heracleum sosnowskyi TaxID=360622 RepID=A0AAD8J9Q2_9APIA|nr:hypothetical protein POM88_009604 [Heracleum sosnowskyi]
MTSQADSKVRMVRCPKCKHVLRELVEVPIYRCGGCGAILQAKKRGKDLPCTESQAHEADAKHMNEVQDISENPIAEESCLGTFPKRVDSTIDDRIEPLGEINKSSQPNGSDAITCDHEIKDLSTEARTRSQEEEGKLPAYQYGAADQDSESSASNEIFQKYEVENTSENPITEKSCITKFPKRVDSTTDDMIESVGEIDKSSQLNGSNAITCDHETEGSSAEARECTKEEEGNLPLYPYGAVDQDKDIKNSALNDILQKNEVENTSENPITEESYTDTFPKRADNTTDDRIESLGEINKSTQLYGSDAMTCNEIDGPSREARAHAVEEEGKLPLYQHGAVDQEKDSRNSASNEILSFSVLNQHASNSLVPEVQDHESESFLSSIEIGTQSLLSSSECNCEGEKSSAGIEIESPGSSEDNCAGGKKEFENELQFTSENPSSDNEELEKVQAGGQISADGRKEWIANLSLESIKPSEADKCEISFNQSGTDSNYRSGDDEKSGDVSVPNEVFSSPKLNHLENDSSLSGYHMYGSGKSLVSPPKQVAGYSSPRNDNEGKSEHPSEIEEVDENTRNLLILTSTNAEPLLDTAVNDQIFTAKSFSSEGISLDNLLPPPRELQQVESSMVPGFRHVSSDDTLENMTHLYAKGDMGVTLRSSTSKDYYAFDDSTSSNETDNEVPDRRFQLVKKSFKDVDPYSTKVLPERSKLIMNHVIGNESELQRQLMNSESSLHGKKHSTIKVSRSHQDELLQRARYRSPVRNRMKNERDYYHSRPLFSRYSSHADQGNSSSSNYGKNDFSALPDNPHELHRLELLRMVYELQNQLKRTRISEGMPRESVLTRPSKGKGGAPIVACYQCSELLQLPAESFLFKRRCHQLKCGACSEIAVILSTDTESHVSVSILNGSCQTAATEQLPMIITNSQSFSRKLDTKLRSGKKNVLVTNLH